ncbi:hypothetical protein H8D64_01995 [PVC group bacterium]|nr:hypothetical protein [PVC group bacterium]
MRKILFGIIVTVIGMTSIVSAAKTTPTNFKAVYLELPALKEKLAVNGLEVLGTHQVAGSNDYTVLVYTSKNLKKAAAISERGFIAVLHILHNNKKKEIVAFNPEYFMRAFLQKDYKDGMAKPVIDALAAALGKLTPTKDFLKTKKLKKYHFMLGMPYYDDFVRVGKGTTADLLQKLQKNAKDRIVFVQKLNEKGSSLLCGVALSKKIENFNQKLETMGQSHLLPYSVLIENGEANILHAKYYLALSFPNLSMGEFMKIRAVPGDIEDAFEEIFE